MAATLAGCGAHHAQESDPRSAPVRVTSSQQPAWSIIAADSHGAVIARGQRLRGVDRAGRIQWRRRLPWTSVACQGPCPEALVAARGTITHVGGSAGVSSRPTGGIDRVLLAGTSWLLSVDRPTARHPRPLLVLHRLGGGGSAASVPLPSPDTLWYWGGRSGALVAYDEHGHGATMVRVRLGAGDIPTLAAAGPATSGPRCTMDLNEPTLLRLHPRTTARVAQMEHSTTDCVTDGPTTVLLSSYLDSSNVAHALVAWTARGDVVETRAFSDFVDAHYLEGSRTILLSTSSGTVQLDASSGDTVRELPDAVDNMPIADGYVLLEGNGQLRWASHPPR